MFKRGANAPLKRPVSLISSRGGRREFREGRSPSLNYTPPSLIKGVASKVILRSETTKNPLSEGDSTDSSLPLRFTQGFGSE